MADAFDDLPFTLLNQTYIYTVRVYASHRENIMRILYICVLLQLLLLTCDNNEIFAQDNSRSGRFVRHLQALIGQNPDGTAESDARETAKELLSNKKIDYNRYEKYGGTNHKKNNSYNNGHRNSAKYKTNSTEKYREIDESFFKETK